MFLGSQDCNKIWGNKLHPERASAKGAHGEDASQVRTVPRPQDWKRENPAIERQAGKDTQCTPAINEETSTQFVGVDWILQEVLPKFCYICPASDLVIGAGIAQMFRDTGVKLKVYVK